MAFDNTTAPTLDELLGITPPDMPADVSRETFQPQRGQGHEFFAGLENVGGQPRGFGESFLAGLAGSLGRGGTKVAEARAKFNENRIARQAKVDEQRLAATKELQRLRNDRISDVRKSETKSAADIASENRANAEFNRRETFKRDLPATAAEKRAQTAAERAAAAAERQVTNQERLGRQTDSTIINQMVDDYRMDPSVAAYRTANQNLSTIKAAQKEPSGFGDLAMLIAYVRATEPGVLSVVRQEELQNVGQAVGKLQQYVNIPNQWVSGQRLTPQGRAAILRAGTTLAGSQKANYERSREIFKRRATRLGIDPSLVMQEFTDAEKPAASGAAISDADLRAEYRRLSGSR